MTLIEQILEKAKAKSDAAEVFHSKSEETSAAWNSDRIKLAEGKETNGVALRVLIGGKVGFFATSKIDDPDLIVDTACELALLGSEFAGEFPKTYEPAAIDTYHEETAGIGTDQIVEAGNAMVGKAKSAVGEAMYDSKIGRTIIEADIANSYGARTGFRKSIFSGYLSGAITREGDVLAIWEYDSSPVFAGQPDIWADETVRKLRDAANIVTIPSGEYQCILTPKAMDMFGPLRSAMNARMVLKDMSPFKDKVGEKIFDERITIIDDGVNADMVEAQPTDDEGVTGQKTMLVENGVLKGFIHDLHTASRMGVAPTGNGMKMGLSANPRAGFTTLTLSPGTKSLDEMIAGIEKGVLIDQVMGAHQASPFSGDFSVSVSLGFLIENGKIVGRFKDAMLAGNVFRMLKEQVIEIGSEPANRIMYTPALHLDRMTVATQG